VLQSRATVTAETSSTSAVFFEIQSTEESQLHDLRLAGVDLRQRLERIIKSDDVQISALSRLEQPTVVQR
jgi:hypothetical protein